MRYLWGMALIHCDFFSEALGMGSSMKVILPQPRGGAANPGEAEGVPGEIPGAGGEHGFPTLWLLHGLSDDHSAWTRRTSIERYVSEMNLAVVMPSVDRSYYADMARGGRYWEFVSEELPRVCRQMFRLSARREDNFVAGLSMGGYGAFKLALNFPERYAAAASLSGALDPGGLLDEIPDRAHEWQNIFGDPPRVAGTAADLFGKSEALMRDEYKDLPLYACCGTSDFIYHHSNKFRDHAERLGLNFVYEEHESRDHEWGYWDQQIRRVLEWLPLKKTGDSAAV